MENLILNKQKYKLVITEKLEEKIRFLCNRFPNNEYSGVLFYTYKGSFQDNDLVLSCEDFLLMDYGSATFTSFETSPDIISYMVENNLLDYQQGLLHSHNKMSTFFSSTDIDTLKKEGFERNNFLSLIVNNNGNYSAAITRKIKHDKHIQDVLRYFFFDKDDVKFKSTDYNEEVFDVEYFMLDIEKPELTQYNDIINRIDKITSAKSSNSKVILDVVSKELLDTNDKPSYNDKPLYPQKDLFDDNGFKDDVIDYDNVIFNKDKVHEVVRKLLFANPIFTPKIPIEEWVEKMSSIMGNKFTDNSYENYMMFYVEYLLENTFDDDLALRGYMEDYQIALCAFGVAEELHKYNTNKYIDIIINEVEKYIY